MMAAHPPSLRAVLQLLDAVNMQVFFASGAHDSPKVRSDGTPAPPLKNFGKIRSYVLVTGTETHFLIAMPRVPDCPKHTWGKCDPIADGRHPPLGGLSAPSHLKTRAFFAEGRDHHCAAGVTHDSKRMTHEELKITDFGQRSSNDGEPFCEIFNFEEILCCQTCVFFEVCAQSKLFKLPCM